MANLTELVRGLVERDLRAGDHCARPPEHGDLTANVLADPKRPYSQRLSAVGTVRFFQATRPAESKATTSVALSGVT